MKSGLFLMIKRGKCRLSMFFGLSNRFHGKRLHEQEVANSLVAENFMWVIWNHIAVQR